MFAWNHWLRCYVTAGIALACIAFSQSSRAQQLGKPAPSSPIDVPSSATNFLAMSFQQRCELLKRYVESAMPEIEIAANEGALAIGSESQTRIQLLRVGKCVAAISTQGGFKQKSSDERGLVGICIVHGDLNVPSSETVFAVSIGAWRVSRQEHPLKGTEATLESIVAIDAEEP